jgi:hypothetical protein
MDRDREIGRQTQTISTLYLIIDRIKPYLVLNQTEGYLARGMSVRTVCQSFSILYRCARQRTASSRCLPCLVWSAPGRVDQACCSGQSEKNGPSRVGPQSEVATLQRRCSSSCGAIQACAACHWLTVALAHWQQAPCVEIKIEMPLCQQQLWLETLPQAGVIRINVLIPSDYHATYAPTHHCARTGHMSRMHTQACMHEHASIGAHTHELTNEQCIECKKLLTKHARKSTSLLSAIRTRTP